MSVPVRDSSKAWTHEQREDGWWCYDTLGQPHGPLASENDALDWLQAMEDSYDIS